MTADATAVHERSHCSSSLHRDASQPREPMKQLPRREAKCAPRRHRIVWFNVYYYVLLHSLALIGLVLVFTRASLLTSLSAVLWYIASGIGVTAGGHRLWAHRAYRATLPLRTLLMLMFSMAGENDIFEWARDHRVHHRFSETEADPHNANRGFFFAHMGWLLVRKQPEVIAEGRKMDMTDLLQDPLVCFNRRFYLPIMLLMNLAVPTYTAVWLWGEQWPVALLVCGVLKYVVTLHCTWAVNSAAHMWGWRPYDHSINPSENRTVAVLAVGEGWHNYHHVFPWDYKAAELPGSAMNITTLFIDFFALFGWAYDLKIVSQDVIDRRAERMGDGSHEISASS